MRPIAALCLLILLAACSGTPQSLGITGPGTQPLPPTPTIDTPESSPAPGLPTAGTSYGPTYGPTTGGSGFWGYN